ncbi:unnamed protein product [Oppiella nova]|uniref:Uncharacterized protein n=1 Tax=Oppiella nova TaxID=334625 RepID=A0A7R9M4I2_9ACAR|nr:unnamed protein product [Oppiella nova]CAG2170609.1 unnamed protein product [Oppiella nova]
MSFQFNANTIETPIMMNMYEPNRQQHNNRNTMNCFRRKTNLELHLIFYLILTVILCTIIVVFNNFTSTHSTPIVIIEKDRKYVDLNYQPVDTDPHLQAVILKARNSVELLRNALNIPCVGVGVAVNGSTVWAEGVGYSDIENGVKCHRQSAFSLITH